MESRKNDSKRSTASSSSDQSSDSTDPRQALSELATRHCALKTEDALCYFLKIHLCIYDKIDSSRFTQMAQLNPIFANKCIDVCTAFLENRSFKDRPSAWLEAFGSYMDEPCPITLTLALMAKAHIMCDLPVALYELEVKTGIAVDEDQYEGVYLLIVECMNQMDADLKSNGMLIDEIALQISKNLHLPRNFHIWRLRAKAWEAYKLLRRIERGRGKR